MKTIYLYSDGSCLNNPGPGGWAYILEYGKHSKKESGGQADTTNNQMEIMAVIKGLQAIKEPCNVEIFTDSSYVANSINVWLENWKKKNFKNVKNLDLWKKYLEISKEHNIKANWVKAHNGHPQNEECDTMAKQEAEKIKSIRD